MKKLFQQNSFLILWGLALFIILPLVPIFDGDTFYYIAKAKRMLLTGDVFNTGTFMTKPVLGLWLMTLSYKLLGINLFSTYLWHLLLGFGCVALVYKFMAKFATQQVATYSAVALATSLMFFYQTCSPMLDIPLIFILILSHYYLFSYLSTEQDKYIYLFNISLGLSFLTKGLIGVIIPLATFFIYGLINQRGSLTAPFKSWKWLLGLVMALLIVSIWLVPQIQVHGADFTNALYRENIERFFHPIDETGGYRQVSSQTQRDPHMNLIYLVLAFLPWSALIIPVLVYIYQNKYLGKKDLSVFLMAWFYFVLFVTTISGHYKGPRYLLPLLPALAMLVGLFLDAKPKLKPFWQKFTARSFFWVGMFMALLTVYSLVGNFGANENNLKPLVVPFLGLLAIVQFVGWHGFGRGNYQVAFGKMAWITLIAFVLFLSSGSYYLRNFLPEYSTAAYFQNIQAPIYVWKNKVRALDFYLNREIKYIDKQEELKTIPVGSYIVTDKREAKAIQGKVVFENMQWKVFLK